MYTSSETVPVSIATFSSNRIIVEDFIKIEYIDYFDRWVNSFGALEMRHFTSTNEIKF